MAQARDFYDIRVDEQQPRRRRIRYLLSLLAGAASEGAFAPEPVVYDVRLVRRDDGTVALDQPRLDAETMELILGDWEALSVEDLERRWFPDHTT